MPYVIFLQIKWTDSNYKVHEIDEFQLKIPIHKEDGSNNKLN